MMYSELPAVSKETFNANSDSSHVMNLYHTLTQFIASRNTTERWAVKDLGPRISGPEESGNFKQKMLKLH
jgi:hypothetical protein